MSRINLHTFLLVFCLIAAACSDGDIIIHESSEKSESYLPPFNCSQLASCYESDGVKVWLEQETVKEETPFFINMTVESSSKISIHSAKIEGINMNMGYIPVFFKELKTNTYRAEGMVGICAVDDMQWQLQLILKKNKNPLVIELFIPIKVTK